MTKLLLDSWAWLELFGKGSKTNKVLAEVAAADEILTTTANVYEVLYRLAEDAGEGVALEKKQFMQNASVILPIDLEIASKAAEIKRRERLSAIDALTLAAARLNDAKVLTGDSDFKNIKDAVYLE